MISGLLESVWELTDASGLRLVSHDSMCHVWEVQQKHLECLQDPAGVLLYTKVGTLQKELDILRCGRGSSSLESFHRHQCAFIPGTFVSRRIVFLVKIYFLCYERESVVIIQNNAITTVRYSYIFTLQ